jgi:cell division protein FtsW
MRRYASILTVSVLALISIGLVVLASTGSVRGGEQFGDPNHYVNRQLIWLLVAVVVAVPLACFNYLWWRKLALPLYLAGVILLILPLIPGIGRTVGGSARWISLRFFNLQPSEAAKFSTVVALSAWLALCGRRVLRMGEGLIGPLLILALPLGLIFLSPDFGTAFLMALVGGALLWAAGTRFSYLATTGFAGLCLFFLAVARDPLRMGRILAVLWPEKHPDVYYQLSQSKIAFISGGAFGVGLGNSMQKQHYLPEAHTDFIYAIIGEEMGFLFTGLVLALFAAILVCGLVISVRAADPFGKLLAFGLTMTLCLQAILNIGVVTGCLPTTGIALPFISYGGSSLVSSLAVVAVLVNIAYRDDSAYRDRRDRVVKDRLHRV